MCQVEHRGGNNKHKGICHQFIDPQVFCVRSLQTERKQEYGNLRHTYKTVFSVRKNFHELSGTKNAIYMMPHYKKYQYILQKYVDELQT